MASESAKRKAAARLAALDRDAKAQETKKTKAALRIKARMGDRETRRKAASELSSMKPSQWKRN